jgi:hypothetical protein
MKLQTWRRVLNEDRVGLLCFFIPAVWQGYANKPTLFCVHLWDGCERNATFGMTLRIIQASSIVSGPGMFQTGTKTLMRITSA